SANESERRCHVRLGAQAHGYVGGRCRKGLGEVGCAGQCSGEDIQCISFGGKYCWQAVRLGGEFRDLAALVLGVLKLVTHL
nr:hypothetical protein [Tanacetum cinerariifolium]